VSPLTLDVFNTGYTPVNGGPGWDSTNQATWPACTTTLISGDADAVLVDAPMTIKQGQELPAWIHAKGKNVSSVVITHGHGDHFFGAAKVWRRFRTRRW
jgi:glyoxylase-like metal-dependent hydrolase (beta-lactamase superfamily II)